MKFVNIILAVSLFSSMSSAAQTLNVVQCPATNDSVKLFRNKLSELKAAIKNEANCAPIKADIAHLGDLLTKDRPKFVDLIAQGQIEGLSETEQGTVESYVNDLTVTTYNLLAVVTGNDACFEEDKQGSSMQFLSSVIGEGAKLLAVVGGPQLGPIIGIAGEAITGFMGAMQTLAENRIGYDFSENDQQIAYADNLCTLFDARRELMTMVDSAESVSRLLLLQESLQKQVNILATKCPECNEIKAIVDAQVNRTTGSEIVSIGQVWPKDFEMMIAEKAKQVDALYTNPLGTNIFRQLKTLTWIPLRVEALRAQEFNVDIVLSSVIGEMESIENFLIKDQAPQYLDSLLRDAEETLWDLNKDIEKQTYLIGQKTGQYMPVFNGLTFLGGAYDTPEDFYNKFFPALENLRSTTQDAEVQDEVDEFIQTLDSKSRYMNVKLDVLDKYCAFFQTTKWGWKAAGLDRICQDEYVGQLKQQALLLTNFRMLMAADGSEDADLVVMDVPVEAAPVLVGEEASADWVESLRKDVEAQATDVYYVERVAN